MMKKSLKTIVCVVFSVIAVCGLCQISFAKSTKTIYLSASGNDENSGETADFPMATLESAIDAGATRVIILDDISLSKINELENLPVLEGAASSIKLTLPSSVTLKSNLKIDKLLLSGTSEIIANGFSLEIGESVTTANNLTVYGGKNGETLVGDTNITLLGGKYSDIFGGGKDANIEGNTNVIVGGNVNPGKDIDDSNGSTLSPTFVYGGGLNGEVSGTANVTLTGNAAVRYLAGAGKGTTAQCYNTNVRIEGGKVMNAYGGATSSGPTLTNCNTKITMTGGVAESLVGGSECLPMTGNTVIELLGGKVYRRVYSGCYNDAQWSGISLNWSSNHYVTGTTTIMIYPTASVNQSSYLSSDNNSNVGVYAGSRIKSASSAEFNTVIFEENCYSSQKGVMGSQDFLAALAGLKSYPDYTVQSGLNGITKSAYEAGKIYIQPNAGYLGVVNNTQYKNEKVAVTGSTTKVTFIVDPNPPAIPDLIETVTDADNAERTLTAEETVTISESNLLKNATIDASSGQVVIGTTTLIGKMSFDENGNIVVNSGDTVKMESATVSGVKNIGFVIAKKYDVAQDESALTVNVGKKTFTEKFNTANITGNLMFTAIVRGVSQAVEEFNADVI